MKWKRENETKIYRYVYISAFIFVFREVLYLRLRILEEQVGRSMLPDRWLKLQMS